MDIRHIRSGSVSLSESRLLRFSLAPTPEFKPDIPDVKIDLGPADKPVKNVDDVKPVIDKLITDASSTIKGTGEKIAALTDQGLQFGKEQLGKFNEFVGKLNLPKPAAEADVNADNQAPVEEQPAAPEQGGAQPAAEQADEQPAAQPEAVEPQTEKTDGAPEAKGEKAPEGEKKEPKTHRQLLQKELDNANAILRNPASKGMDKLMAGIQALGALKQMMDRAFKGTLDEPLGKKEDPAATAKDGSKETSDGSSKGSKEKDGEGGEKDGEKEKGGSESDREANPESDEKRNQPENDRRTRLWKEIDDTKGGHPEVLKGKNDAIEKSKEKVKDIDSKIDGLEERHDTLDDEQDADRAKLRNLEQELGGAEEGDKGDLEEQITDLKEDMDMRADEMKVLDANRQKLLDRKERKQPKALEKDVTELEDMRADKEAEIKQLNETIQTIADGLRSAPDATPDMLAFAKILDDEEHTLDEKTLDAVASKEADAAVIEFAKSMDYELPKGWEKNTTAFAEAMEGLGKAVVEKSTKKESGEGADRAAAPSEGSSDGGAETAANHLREVADASAATRKAIAEFDQLVDVKGEPRYRDALKTLVDAIQYEQGVIKHDAENIPLEQAQRLQEISALLPRYEQELAELDAASKKQEQNKDEAPDLNKEDAEKFSKWAKAIEDRSNELGYAVTVTAGKDGSMTIAHKGEYDETAAKAIEKLSNFAADRGMTPVENEDHSLSINVQIKDEGKGYFGQVNEEFVQQFELKAGDALETAGKEKEVAQDAPAEPDTPNPR